MKSIICVWIRVEVAGKLNMLHCKRRVLYSVNYISCYNFFNESRLRLKNLKLIKFRYCLVLLVCNQASV